MAAPAFLPLSSALPDTRGIARGIAGARGGRHPQSLSCSPRQLVTSTGSTRGTYATAFSSGRIIDPNTPFGALIQSFMQATSLSPCPLLFSQISSALTLPLPLFTKRPPDGPFVGWNRAVGPLPPPLLVNLSTIYSHLHSPASRIPGLPPPTDWNSGQFPAGLLRGSPPHQQCQLLCTRNFCAAPTGLCLALRTALLLCCPLIAIAPK